MQDNAIGPIIGGEARMNLDIDLTEAEEAARVLSESPLETALTAGQQIAQHSLGMRRKYGRYPVPSQVTICGLWMPWAFPLPGHESDEVVPFPDVSEKALMRRPLNRHDDRARFKFWKMESFTKSFHKKHGVAPSLGSRGRRIKTVRHAS